MTDFWKIFISIMAVNIFAELTYLNMDYFQYSFFSNGDFLWISLLKLLLEVIICAPVFMGVYFLMDKIPKWRMAAKYKAAEREREKERVK